MAINLGNTTAVDFYSGNTPVDRIYLGQSKIYDAFSEISGTLPLRYNARRAENLKNYQIYGTAEGTGAETENILDFSDLMSAPSGAPEGQGSSSVFDHLLILEAEPSTEYTLASDGAGSITGIADTNRCVYFNSNISASTVFEGHPVTATSSETGYLYIGFLSSRTNAQQYINGAAHLWLVKGSTAPSYIPHGYKLSLSVESGTQSQDISVYIGDSKLGVEEYTDYEEQKVYKVVEGVLTPVDPPVALPPIPTYKGENILSSMETLGEVTVKGRIKRNLPDWYKDGWQSLLEDSSFYETWQVIVAAATTPTSGTVPNCTVMYGSFAGYYGYNNQAINITDMGNAIRFTRTNDLKKRKFVTYDSATRTWGSVTTESNSGYFSIGNVVQNIPVKAFIIFTTPNYPGGYVTTLPYQDDL